MSITVVLIFLIFLGTTVLIIIDKINRTILVLCGALITYAILEFIYPLESGETIDYSTFVVYLFGTEVDNYVNFRSILLVFSMMVIVEISKENGIFQFLGFRLIQLTRGRPIPLMAMLCTLAVMITAVINNLLTIIVLVPLTFSVARILNIDPKPYVLAEAYFVTIGGEIFSISSIPSILISTHAGINFNEFFINIGIVSLGIFVLTLILFIFLFYDQLQPSHEGISILLEYNVWTFVKDKPSMIKGLVVLIAMIVGFLFIDPDILSIDLIALGAAILMLVLSKLNPKEIFEKCDWEIVLFIMGISIIVGGMDKVGIITELGNLLLKLSNNQVFPTYMIVLWISGILSAGVDDISITKVMIPVVDVMTRNFTPVTRKFAFYTLNWGINLGDNLFPLGDTIMVFNIAKTYGVHLTFKQYMKYGIITGFYNLGIITVYIGFLYNILYGFVLLGVLIVCVGTGLFFRIKNIILKQKQISPKLEAEILPPKSDKEDLSLDPEDKESPTSLEKENKILTSDRDFD